MALAEIQEVVYIQPDPLFHGISDILFNLTHAPVPGVDKQPILAPRPIPGSAFWTGANYSVNLRTAFTTYQASSGIKFFRAPKRNFSSSDMGITAFLCTDTAYNIFKAARQELDQRLARATPHGASGPVFVQDPNLNVAIRKNAVKFLDYVRAKGGRGLTH